jgi:aminoglycoside phosphotransferase (APT) family kinase protein
VARDAPDTELLAQALAASCGPGTIEGLRRLSGGASRETWSFDLVAPDGARHALVLRRDPPATALQSARSTEYALIAAAANAGVAVPKVRLLLEPDAGLGDGFIMDHIAGETIPRKILRDDEYASARPLLAAQSGQAAAAIHAIDTASLPPLEVQDAKKQLDQQRTLLDGFGEPHPAFELGLRWLADNLPDTSRPPHLVHGDFRHGNFIIGPDGLRAVIDWELSHLGDPIEDLGWLCVKSWRFGNNDQIVGGFGSPNALLDAYEAAGGTRPSMFDLRFWIVMGTLKWGVICVAQSFSHLSGMIRSVELATLGRRVAEMEWDLLDLLDGNL